MAQAQPKSDDDKIIAFRAEANVHGTPEAVGAASDPSDAPVESLSPLALFESRRTRDPHLRVGPCLREIRERSGRCVEDVARELKFQIAYVEAIEAMDMTRIARGYRAPRIIAYARHLGLSGQAVLDAYREECEVLAQETQSETSAVETRASPRHAIPLTPALIGGALVAGAAMVSGLVALSWPSGNGAPEPVAAISATPPAAERVSDRRDTAMMALPALPALEADRAVTDLPLSITATRRAWIEVRGADGTIFRSRDMAAGETYHPRIGAGWTVTARDGGAFEWRVGDAVVGTLGETGADVYAASVDAAARRAASATAPALAATGDGTPNR